MPFARKPDRYSSCIIVPGRVSDPDGFITEQREIDGINGPIKIYFSIGGLRQMAEKYPEIGLVRRDSALAAVRRAKRLEAELTAANDRVAELEAQQERVAGFVRDGYKVQKVMGRPVTAGKKS